MQHRSVCSSLFMIFFIYGVCACAAPADKAQERSPIAYNLRGDEFGVIQRTKPNDDAVMLPA